MVNRLVNSFCCGVCFENHLLNFFFQSLRQQCTRLENRSQLVTVCGLGPQVFLNCAGFIKIDTAAISDTTTNYIEVLDGSRVHPETYEWAKKMAVDALEYDEVTKLACVEVAWQLLGIKAREEGGRRKFPSLLTSFLPSFLARLSRSCAMAVDALEYDEATKPA